MMYNNAMGLGMVSGWFWGIVIVVLTVLAVASLFHHFRK